ncbi:MAG: hypothetical protein AAFQ39_08235 [Pseudomonadota bacterium]
MSPARSPYILAGLAVITAVAFALTVRLPLPFDGFAAVAAAGLAGLLTFTFGLFLPPHWLWTDAERLVHAFRARHEISDARAATALDAITTAHRRAAALREASADFTDALREQALKGADALDAAAREIFYDPNALSVHRANLIRAELIEDSVTAHAALKKRNQGVVDDQIAQSRDKVAAALTSLEGAFDAAEERAANILLTQVDVASSTAETLLARRHTRPTPQPQEDHP